MSFCRKVALEVTLEATHHCHQMRLQRYILTVSGLSARWMVLLSEQILRNVCNSIRPICRVWVCGVSWGVGSHQCIDIGTWG